MNENRFFGEGFFTLFGRLQLIMVGIMCIVSGIGAIIGGLFYFSMANQMGHYFDPCFPTAFILLGFFLAGYGCFCLLGAKKIEEKTKLPDIEKQRLLEERMLRGEISEETYRELKKKYEEG